MLFFTLFFAYFFFYLFTSITQTHCFLFYQCFFTYSFVYQIISMFLSSLLYTSGVIPHSPLSLIFIDLLLPWCYWTSLFLSALSLSHFRFSSLPFTRSLSSIIPNFVLCWYICSTTVVNFLTAFYCEVDTKRTTSTSFWRTTEEQRTFFATTATETDIIESESCSLL